MKSMFRYLFILLLLSSKLSAQKILKDTILQVVKQFQPTIADAFKINEKPVIKDSIPPSPQVNYSINPKKAFTPISIEQLKAAKMVGEPLQQLYNSLVKIGGGNYFTTYSELFYSNGRSKDIVYGAYAKHLSSKATLNGYGFGGVSNNKLELYGKKFFRKHTLASNLNYDRNVVHYYGYDTSLIHVTNNSDIKQLYSSGSANVSLQSHYTDSTHLNYLLKLQYYNLTDLYKTSENNLQFFGDVSGYFSKQLIHAPITIDYFNNKSTKEPVNSTIINLSPYCLFIGEKWTASIGAGLFMKERFNNAFFQLFPNIDFNYNVVGNIIIPYAGLKGEIKNNSLKSISQENPFVNPNPNNDVTTTRKIYAGLRGSISKSISYNTSGSYEMIDNLLMYVSNNSTIPKISGFSTQYDNGSLINLHGELQYQKTEKLKFIGKGDFYNYKMDNNEYAWNKPTWKGTLTVNYNLKSKIIVTATIFSYGKRFDKNSKPDSKAGILVITNRELKPILDANLGLEYRYNKKISAFLLMNNLGFNSYYYWNNYPTYKFNFLAGITMGF